MGPNSGDVKFDNYGKMIVNDTITANFQYFAPLLSSRLRADWSCASQDFTAVVLDDTEDDFPPVLFVLRFFPLPGQSISQEYPEQLFNVISKQITAHGLLPLVAEIENNPQAGRALL